ncbi:MAG: ANTAR domain-containing protein [Lachnospiraceae bacterium]|nr:ANTAR domain-containing protein [Agathobacter sp.]MDD6445717.1 ANTAR domain-containing protein [Lachnospiraceae bacterium]
MSNIVIAFPKPEVAANIRKILSQSGYTVTAVCTTGAKTLESVNNLEQGILICGYRFVDMMYTEIYDYLPPEFQMLLIASRTSIDEREISNLVSLSMPMKVHELLETLEMMEGDIRRRKKRIQRQPKHRSAEDQMIIRQAKELLMVRNSFTEEEAHRYIQKRSMDNGTGLVEVSQMILSLLQEG